MNRFKNIRNLTISYSNRSLQHCSTCFCAPSTASNTMTSIYTQKPNEQTKLKQYRTSRFASQTTPQFFQANTANNDRFFQQSNASLANGGFYSTSPDKIRRVLSAGARFSTKEYIQFHFPYLKSPETDIIFQRFLNRDPEEKRKIEIKEELMPRQHPVLKMKKIKSPVLKTIGRAKSNHTPSKIVVEQDNKLSQSALVQGKVSKQYIHKRSSQKFEEEELSVTILKNNGVDCQSEEKYISQCKTVQKLSSNKKIAQKEEQLKRASSKDIIQNNSLARFDAGQQSSKKQISSKKEVLSKNVAEKYPTVKSIKILESGKKMSSNSQHELSQSFKDDTSLKLTQSRKPGRQTNIYTFNEVDKKIALSLSSHLDLNYDYFILNSDTDRSLSSHVEL